MFVKKRSTVHGEEAIVVSGVGCANIIDTFECGQAFRYEMLEKSEGYTEYMTVVGDRIIRVGQSIPGELIFYGVTDKDIDDVIAPYFSLSLDFSAIAEDIRSRTDSQWLRDASVAAEGILILSQEPWEALFSFIISQNNNIPRIRKIIRTLSLEYGENLAEKNGLKKCPLKDKTHTPCHENCKNCGICYSFPTANAVAQRPEGMESARVGFRYKYLLDAAERVSRGETDLSAIKAMKSYAYTVEELKRIKGVGDKVASCVALFGMGNLEAFPIDVWMKRAIDTYFDGKLDPTTLGEYAGVAQQYIFHYIRNLESSQ